MPCMWVNYQALYEHVWPFSISITPLKLEDFFKTKLMYWNKPPAIEYTITLFFSYLFGGKKCWSTPTPAVPRVLHPAHVIFY